MGPSINYIRIFSRFLDPPTPLVAHSTHLNGPSPLLRTSNLESETPPPLLFKGMEGLMPIRKKTIETYFERSKLSKI